MFNKETTVLRSTINAAMLSLTAFGTTGTAIAQAVAKPSVTSDV